MSFQPVTRRAESVDHSWNWLYKVGGAALFVEGFAYFIILVASPMLGAGPGNNENYLHALASHAGLANFTYAVVAIADFILIPAAFALYIALRGVSRTWMLIAAGIILAYVAIDISTFVLTSTTLVTLTQNFAATANATQRAAILGAEYYGLAAIPLSQFIGYVFPPFAFLIIAGSVRRGRFGRGIPLLGYILCLTSVAGGIGFLDPIPYLLNFQLLALAVYGLFMLALGTMLFRLAGTKPAKLSSESLEVEVQ
jgi:hypothetical protein